MFNLLTLLAIVALVVLLNRLLDCVGWEFVIELCCDAFAVDESALLLCSKVRF